MPTLTVKAASEKKRFDGKFGPSIAYNVDITDESTGQTTMAAELVQKAETPAPQPGDTFQGTLTEDPRFGWRIKKEYAPKGGGGFSNGPRPEDPARSRAITRMHSQEMALRYIHATATKPDDWSAFFAIVDKFDEDVEHARAGTLGG